MKKHLLALLALLYVTTQAQACPTATLMRCTIPVADLYTERPATIFPFLSVEQAQEAVAISNVKGSPHIRAEQLLWNETVEFIEKVGDYTKINHPYKFYASQDGKKSSSYWILNTHLVPSFSQAQETSVVKLIKPLFSKELNRTISAGTPCIVKKETKNFYTCTLTDTNGILKQCKFPKTACCKPYSNKTHQREAFVALVRYWAHQAPYKIPYVLGGCSVIDIVTPNAFAKTIGSYKNKRIMVIERPEVTPIYTGLDCAHLVTLAAQIAGIPLAAANTHALRQSLTPLRPDEHLQEGDLALWKGHVVVISDIKNNLLVEARGYDHGYGIVHEIPLHEQFKGIKTISDLEKAYHTHTRIPRLDKIGKQVEIITDLVLLKIVS